MNGLKRNYMMDYRKSRRREKRYYNHMIKKLKYGCYFEDCNYQPCKVTNASIYSYVNDSSISGIRLTDGGPSTTCSIVHCAPWPLSKEIVEKQAEYLKIPGNKYSDDAFREFQTWKTDYLYKLWIRTKEHQNDS